VAEPTQTRVRRTLAIPVSPELCVLLAALAALTFAAAACRHTPPSVERVEITEPSGGAEAAWCGALRPGMRAILRGHVAAAGCDTRDSFAFVATSACTLRCRVRPSLPAADLAVRAVDASTGRRIDLADGHDAEGSATVRIEHAGAAVDLVVTAAWGSSTYTLDVAALVPGSEEPASRPRVSPTRVPSIPRGFPVETALGLAAATALR
jgi:hypothetical protein